MFDPFLALDFVALSLTILYLVRAGNGSKMNSPLPVKLREQDHLLDRALDFRSPLTTIGVGATISLPKRSLRVQG